MKTLELEKASKTLADYASDLGGDSLVITSNKKAVAALIPIEDADRESLALSLSPQFAKIIRRARAEAKKGNVFSLKQVKQELSKKLEPSRVGTTSPRHRKSGRKKSSG